VDVACTCAQGRKPSSAVPSETLIVRTRSSTSLFGRLSYTNHFDGRHFDRQMLRSFKSTVHTDTVLESTLGFASRSTVYLVSTQ